MTAAVLLIFALVSPAQAVEPRASGVWLDAAAFTERGAGLEVPAVAEFPMRFTIEEKPFSLTDGSGMKEASGGKLGAIRERLVSLKGILKSLLRTFRRRS